MWNNQKLFQGRGFSTPPPPARNPRPMMPMSERKRISPANESDPFHIVHKVPAGDSPYVRAKHVQLIDKDPSKAISLFWAAINSGDRVDSALKDMAIVMKQLDRSDEAIEAIKSFRHLCPYDAQESLDNVLVELYKRSGRVEEEIEMLQLKLKRIEEGIAFGGRRTKTARSQGKKVQISVEQEISRILGNLAWAYLQQNNFSTAEEHYKKALSLEPDKNKQCNLALCLMHMNRLAEAKSLLQAVKASSGNRPMDESYAKSFERALQMLTELESHSVLNPIKQKEGDQNEVNSFGSGGQHSGSAFCRRWADGHDEETTLINENHRGFYQQNHIENKENSFGCGSGTLQCISFGPRSSLQSSPQTMSVDKWKKGPHFESSSERMSSFPTRMKGDCVGSTGTEATAACKSVYSSPTPTRRNLNVPLTQPRRCSWGFSNGHQRREIWGENAVRSSNRKLSFEQSMTTQNVQAPGIQDINGDLLASPSPVKGDWRRSCRDLARLKDVTDSQHIVNQSWKRDSFGDGETKKFALGDSNLSLKVAVEPPMVVDHVRTFIEGEQDQSSGTTVSGCKKPMTTCEEEWFRKNSTGVSDGFHQHIEENSKTAHDNCKKSWADMVEEEEEELLGGRTLMEYYDGWNSEDELNDENLNSNIIYQSPYPQSQSKSLSCKFESFDLKDGYCTSGVALSSRNQTARRSLCFEQQQKPDYICSSPLPKKALNFEGCKSVQANGRDSISRKNEKLIRRNRLQVFREITPHPESP